MLCGKILQHETAITCICKIFLLLHNQPAAWHVRAVSPFPQNSYEFKMFMKLPIFLQLVDLNNYVKLAESSAKLCTYLKILLTTHKLSCSLQGCSLCRMGRIMNQTYLVEMGLLARTEHFICKQFHWMMQCN